MLIVYLYHGVCIAEEATEALLRARLYHRACIAEALHNGQLWPACIIELALLKLSIMVNYGPSTPDSFHYAIPMLIVNH